MLAAPVDIGLAAKTDSSDCEPSISVSHQSVFLLLSDDCVKEKEGLKRFLFQFPLDGRADAWDVGMVSN